MIPFSFYILHFLQNLQKCLTGILTRRISATLHPSGKVLIMRQNRGTGEKVLGLSLTVEPKWIWATIPWLRELCSSIDSTCTIHSKHSQDMSQLAAVYF